MEPQLKKTNRKFDRLSNLPDNIIFDILSLLHMRDISFVCTLSRRLRQLCFSMPCLNISLESSLNLKSFWGVKPIKEQELDSFTRFVERFWHLRNGADLFCLRIDYPFFYRDLNYNMDYRIVTWIYNATTCRVQELDLDIALKNTFCLPLCALNCSSLRVLKLNLNWGKLKLSNVEFNSLQELSLIKFRVVNPLLREWISSYCKALTNLSLRVFYGMSNLNITSFSLQDMKITFHDEVCDVKISAAKLWT